MTLCGPGLGHIGKTLIPEKANLVQGVVNVFVSLHICVNARDKQ